MKYFKLNITSVLLVIVLLLQTSCQKDAFTNANNNQNSPSNPTPSALLPNIELSLAYTQGGDISRYTSLLLQECKVYGGQSGAYYQYQFTSADFDTPWGNMYTSVLGNNIDLMKKADAHGYNVYSGISRVIAAYGLQLLVDCWGKVPYTQALQGDANTHPIYDNDKALYDSIISLTDVAITKLSDADPGLLIPSTDDILYGGDANKWIKFAHAIRARVYIHQSKNNAVMASNALAEASMAFADNSDNAIVPFGKAETAANPIYQFNEQRADIDYGSQDPYAPIGSGFMVDTLMKLNDPRLYHYVYPYDSVNFSYYDVNFVGIGDYYGKVNAGVELITNDELFFIKAEATLRSSGNLVLAQKYYDSAINASMSKYTIASGDIATYQAANILPGTVISAIDQVAFQEYLALFLNPEAWTLWRRTGVPVLIPSSGSSIPRRFLYPETEYSLNGANTPFATLDSTSTTKIFWDK